jgi:NAD(P)-dependent dehydrogenase (short-subunit alcohol dehydrogenase family)
MNVLVTGCSSGFGLLTAVTFARHGHSVVASVRSDVGEAAIREAADLAEVSVEVVRLDVGDPESVRRTTTFVAQRHGPIEVLINNAGIEIFGALHLVTDAEVERQFDTNVAGLLRMYRAVVPSMIAAGSGVIVNIGSIAGQVGVPYSGLYAASKHAVEALSEAMHFEVSHLGIRVALVEPGQFATALGTNSIVAASMTIDTEEHRRWQAFRSAQRGLVDGQPADPQLVADVVYRAATTTEPQLRWPVGDDAALVLGTKAAMSFEEFETVMRSTLDWHD